MAVNNTKIFGGPIKQFSLASTFGGGLTDIGAIGEISIKLEPIKTKAYNSKEYTRVHKLTIEGAALQTDAASLTVLNAFSASDAFFTIQYADSTIVEAAVSGGMPLSIEVELAGAEDSDHSFNLSGIVVGKIDDLISFRS